MTIHKRAISENRSIIQSLNNPNWPEYNMKQIKTASITKNRDLGGFDIESAIEKHPENLFVKIFAIKKDEVNDNGDAFSERELIKATPTFVGVPVFCNHQNDDIEKARGIVIHSWYDKPKGGIFIIARVDRTAWPSLARGIEQGIVIGCFPPGAKVLMEDGTEKNIIDVEIGDSVITGKGNIKKVVNKKSRKENSKLLNIFVAGIKDPITCTENHHIVSYQLPQVCLCGCGIELPETVYRNTHVKHFNRKFKNGHNNRKQTVSHNHIQKIKAKELIETDLLIEPISKDNSKDNFVTVDEAFLIGLFLAEGSFEKRNDVRHSAIFSFAHTELETLASICEDKLASVFSDHRNKPTVNFYPKASQSRVNLYGKDVAKWFYDMCGEYSDGKKLHPNLLRLGGEKTAALIAGYMEGDGYTINKRSCGCATVSKDLASQLRYLLRKINIRTRYRIRKENNYTFGYKDVYEITFGMSTIPEVLRKHLIYKNPNKSLAKKASWHDFDDYVLRKIKKIEEIKYNGYVYDLEIEDDHTYCVNHIAVSNSSMGCSVTASCCSICHNCAATADDYCSCVKERKNKKISGKIKCEYHNSSMKIEGYEDVCPICGSKKGESKTNEYKEAQIYEHNFGIKFIEDSFVVNPACHDCLVEEIFNKSEFEKKVASVRDKVFKLSEMGACMTNTCSVDGKMQKVAGKQELDELTTAMDIVEKVAKSMMTQKEYVSMEYVSDLVKTLADIQSVADELVEMGYGQLPSPQLTGEEDIQLPKDSISEQQPLPPTQQLQPSSPVRPVGMEQSNLGELGTVTVPKMSRKKEDFWKQSSILIERISNLSDHLKQTLKEQILPNKESNIMADTKDSQEQTSMEKTAEQSLDVINEKQLPEKDTGAGQQWQEDTTIITEKQFEDPDKHKPDGLVGSIPSGQGRKGSYDVITEKQFNSVQASYVARWDDYPSVITEKQWGEISRLVGSELSKEQDTIITEKQMQDFLSKHRYADLNIITEKQIGDQDGQIARWAYTFDPKRVIKTAMDAISDTIAFYNKTPAEVQAAASFLNENPKNADKAAMLVLVNAMPNKKEARANEKTKYTYFSKLASSSVETPSTVDALIVSISDNLGDLSADDLIQGIKHTFSNKKGIKQAEEAAKRKLAAGPSIVHVADRSSMFDSAIAELDRPEDGTYQIMSAIEEIGADPQDKQAFVEATHKFVDKQIDDDIKTAITNIDIDEYTGAVVATVKEVNVLTKEEKEAISQLTVKEAKSKEDKEEKEEKTSSDERKEKRAELVKEAQMLGGEMGGQAGAGQAPGAGATLPNPPDPMSQDSLESFEQSDLGEDVLGEYEDFSPKPPGSICPVCSSKDVDIIKGAGKCNNCGSEFEFKVSINVTKWADFVGDSQDDGAEEESAIEGEGFELPEAGEAPPAETAGIPAAASTKNNKVEKVSFAMMTRFTKEAANKIAKDKIELGSVSPLTGTTETVKLENGERLCLDTGIKYKVAYAADSKHPEKVYAQWEWIPSDLVSDCDNCKREKDEFLKSLEAHGIDEKAFDALSPKEKGKTILAMKSAGLMKTASSKTGSVVEQYKEALGPIKEFPEEICREKIARRYGLDAVALSGPYEGQPLCDAICKILKKAGIYSNTLAVKVANIWCDKDGLEECVEDYVREGFELKQASVICEAMKAKYAQFDDFVSDELGSLTDDEDFEDDDFEEEEDFDPFDAEAETVTIELPSDVAERLSEAVEESLGGVTEEVEIDVDVEVPDEEAAEEVVEDVTDEVVEDVTDEEIGEPVEDEVIEDEVIEEDKECAPCVDDVKNYENKEGDLEEDIEDQGMQFKESDPEKDCCAFAENEASNMKSGHINKTNEINLDLSGVLDILNKKAGEIGLQNAQDSVSGYSGDSTIGDESSFTAADASAPTGKATMGAEPDDLQQLDKATAPTADARMGEEEDVLKPELDDKATGGDIGAGNAKAASTKERVNSLADSIIKITKEADEKKVVRKQDQDDEDVKPYSGDSFIKNEKESIGDVPEAKTTPDGIPQDSALMGDEQASLGNKPDPVKDTPNIPADDARMGDEGDKISPEKQEQMEGHVTPGALASGRDESKITKEAYRLAGLMLQSGLIEPQQLETKVAELSEYRPAQLADLEKGMFVKKGLDAPADGLEGQAVVISEVSTEKLAKESHVNPQEELVSKLQSLFSLDNQVKLADTDPNNEIRKGYGR